MACIEVHNLPSCVCPGDDAQCHHATKKPGRRMQVKHFLHLLRAGQASRTFSADRMSAPWAIRSSTISTAHSSSQADVQATRYRGSCPSCRRKHMRSTRLLSVGRGSRKPQAQQETWRAAAVSSKHLSPSPPPAHLVGQTRVRSVLEEQNCDLHRVVVFER